MANPFPLTPRMREWCHNRYAPIRNARNFPIYDFFWFPTPRLLYRDFKPSDFSLFLFRKCYNLFAFASNLCQFSDATLPNRIFVSISYLSASLWGGISPLLPAFIADRLCPLYFSFILENIETPRIYSVSPRTKSPNITIVHTYAAYWAIRSR